jgi:hypothetical protein
MNSVLGVAAVLVAAVPLSAQEPGLRRILKDASQLARRQDEHQRYWSDRALLAIADIQTRAGDFDGAMETIKACRYDGGTNAASAHLANAFAKAGQREQAFAVLRQMGSDHGRSQDWLEDDVKLSCLQYEISIGDRTKARAIIDELTMPTSRVEGLRRLASAYATVGDKAAAGRAIELALAASKTVPEEFDRARALWETADAQMAQGKSLAAPTIRELERVSESFQDPWARTAALREAAVPFAEGHPCRAADALSLGEKSIAAILDAPTTFLFVEKPLLAFTQSLRANQKIEIRMDSKAMHDAGVDPDTPVTVDLKGIPLRSALRILLRDLNLCYITDGDGLLITSPENAANQRLARTYPIGDVLAVERDPRGGGSIDSSEACKALIKAIQDTIEPGSWAPDESLTPEMAAPREHRKAIRATTITDLPAGGGPKALVAVHNADVHQQIAELLACLRSAKSGGATQLEGIARDPTAAEKRIEDELDRHVDLDFKEMPLPEGTAELKRRFEIEIQHDHATLQEGSFPGENVITRKFENVPLRLALRQILKDVGFTFIIRDEVLWITTPQIAAEQLAIKVYRLPRDTKAASSSALLQDLRGIVPPHSHGGVAIVDLGVPILIARQTPKVHQAIVLRLARGYSGKQQGERRSR